MKSRSFSNLNIIKDYFEFVSIIGVGGMDTDDVVNAAKALGHKKRRGSRVNLLQCYYVKDPLVQE